jgi:N-acetylmuramoyl-L-alanine amidase
MPGALAEPLFLTDPTDAAIIESRAGQETVAGALATAVDEYFHGGA